MKPETASTGPGSALRNRNFALLWTGQTVSIAGNGIYAVALPLEVFRFTDNALDLAVVLGANTVPMVALLLIAGAIVDRVSRRLVMLLSNTVNGLLFTLMTVVISTGQIRLWMLVACSLVTGTTLAFFLPASSAIFRDILPPELMVNANSLSSLSQGLAQYMAGPLLGGVIVAAGGTAWAFGSDAASFLVSFGCLAAMSGTVRRTAGDAGGAAHRAGAQLLAEMRAGLRYCRSRAWLWWSMLAMAVANFACFTPLFVFEPLLVRHFFGGKAVALGLIFAANGAGGTLASLYITRYGAPRKRIAAVWAGLSGCGAGTALLGISPSIWMATILAGLLWAAATYGNILWLATIQEAVPPGLLGRVASLDWLVSSALAPLGILAGGALASAAGVRAALVTGGVVAACAGSVALLPRVREPDRRPGASVTEPSKAEA
ncbi:MAG TPA: MFS transporter [Streptosporangiaceae bacterium]|jgi:MFS family permease|nr:MFS transporter [Streptosporangiaceae bacterium]